MKRAGLMLLFVGCLIAFSQQAFAAGEYAPKDAFVGGSSHPYYGRDHGGCTTTPTMNYAVHITFMSTD